jgi:hypothetical protein
MFIGMKHEGSRCVFPIFINIRHTGQTPMQENDFHEVADEFINLANELSEAWATPFLSAAFMYAAARYNTHFFFESDGAMDSQSAAIDYYCDQYRKMLLECMHDFRNSEAAGGG